jgi:hypothetical protein
MGQQFCTICGAKLSSGIRFCESCGAPVEPELPKQSTTPATTITNPPAGSGPVRGHQDAGSGKIPVTILAGIVILLIIAAVAVMIMLPKLQDSGISGINGGSTPASTAIPTQVSTPETIAATPELTSTPDPFPGAFRMGERMPFGSGEVASEGTVYRYWINDTYQWHNDMDNKYYPQKPGPGNKYLFIFVHMVNHGTTRVWLPHAGTIRVYYDGNMYSQDQNHYKPDKTGDLKATAIEVGEVQYYHKLNGDEYVEDFGYSHGTELGYIYPGRSNAVDGYIIYEVPQSLTPDKTYVAISFNGQDQGIWKLA